MPSYRAFLIDKQGKVFNAQVLDASNDQEAMETAKQYVNGCAVQVWKRERLIGHLKADADSEAPAT